MEQPVNLKRGHVREDGMVLLRRNYGIEKWGTVEQYKNLIAKQYAWQKKRRISGRKVIRRWKLGELNVETGLYFIRMLANYRPKFGTLGDLNNYKNQRKTIHQDYLKKKLKKNPYIYKRGDIDPVLNLYFWKYNTQSGTPIWLTKKQFIEKSKKENLATKLRREQKKHGKA